MEKSFLAPSGQRFLAPGISNARSSRDIVEWLGIDDFAIFNPYYHYYSTPATPGSVTGSRGAVYIDYRVDYNKPLPGSGLI